MSFNARNIIKTVFRARKQESQEPSHGNAQNNVDGMWKPCPPSKDDFKNLLNATVYTEGILPVFELEQTSTGVSYTLVNLSQRIRDNRDVDSVFYSGFLRKARAACNVLCLSAVIIAAVGMTLTRNSGYSSVEAFSDFLGAYDIGRYTGAKINGRDPDKMFVTRIGPKPYDPQKKSSEFMNNIARINAQMNRIGGLKNGVLIPYHNPLRADEKTTLEWALSSRRPLVYYSKKEGGLVLYDNTGNLWRDTGGYTHPRFLSGNDEFAKNTRLGERIMRRLGADESDLIRESLEQIDKSLLSDYEKGLAIRLEKEAADGRR